ncbi:unnamed protein product [Fusarium graminearum]|uniref:Chromosome 4, complete genome n=1 Tax=Gibberella zeae (strain ATCC MYA-4620 / CBS 123657 / FGSC 9075 / NRRL 31084 / PH-1) TaxID=229533 RepID=A0A098DSL7_GIBZE|nr:unnamed protein product [Fusarium graminearum]CZS73742.1 unnamed protein product [Fusarium graminearum]
MKSHSTVTLICVPVLVARLYAMVSSKTRKQLFMVSVTGKLWLDQVPGTVTDKPLQLLVADGYNKESNLSIGLA